MKRIESSSPTLLVFTLGDARESRRRRLLPAAHGALERRLHRACLDGALEAGRTAGCRLAVSSPTRAGLPTDVHHHQQQGRGFGQRLRNAVTAAFSADDGPVVLVGTDVPGLEAAHVQQAVEGLRDDPERVILGPSPDGGIYLLAAARPLDEALAATRWCSRRTLRSLARALRRQGRRVVLLPPLVDLDHRADLERWLARRRSALTPSTIASWRRLIGRLAAVLAEIRRIAAFDPQPVLRPVVVSAPPQRGPPRPVRRLL